MEANNKNDFLLPKKYKVNQFIRWITLIFGVFVIIYALYYILFEISSEMTKIKKFVPFLMLFLGFNSTFKNLFTINSIYMDEAGIKFGYLLRKAQFIKWDSIYKYTFKVKKGKALVIHYTDEANHEKKYYLMLSFKNMLEILNYFAQFSPKAEFGELLQPIVINNKNEEKK